MPADVVVPCTELLERELASVDFAILRQPQLPAPLHPLAEVLSEGDLHDLELLAGVER